MDFSEDRAYIVDFSEMLQNMSSNDQVRICNLLATLWENLDRAEQQSDECLREWFLRKAAVSLATCHSLLLVETEECTVEYVSTVALCSLTAHIDEPSIAFCDLNDVLLKDLPTIFTNKSQRARMIYFLTESKKCIQQVFQTEDAKEKASLLSSAALLLSLVIGEICKNNVWLQSFYIDDIFQNLGFSLQIEFPAMTSAQRSALIAKLQRYPECLSLRKQSLDIMSKIKNCFQGMPHHS